MSPSREAKDLKIGRQNWELMPDQVCRVWRCVRVLGESVFF